VDHSGELTNLEERRVILDNLLELLWYITTYVSLWDFADIAEAMYAGLGGEWWVGDTLCWVDGVKVGVVPELKGE